MSNTRATTVLPEHMQAAWERLHRPGWLPLHQAALAAAQYRLVQGMAQRLANGERPAAEPEPAPEPAVRHIPKPGPWPPAPPLPTHPPQMDRMRLASGERPDDD